MSDSSTRVTPDVRPIEEGDVEDVIRIDRLVGGSRSEGWWRGLLSLYADPEADDSERLSSTLCQIALLEGKVVGFVLGDIQSWQFGMERCGRIVAIGVDPKCSRRGVGSELARALLRVFAARNLRSVQCLVRPDDPLHSFFTSAGFEPSEFRVLDLDLGGTARSE